MLKFEIRKLVSHIFQDLFAEMGSTWLPNIFHEGNKAGGVRHTNTNFNYSPYYYTMVWTDVILSNEVRCMMTICFCDNHSWLLHTAKTF